MNLIERIDAYLNESVDDLPDKVSFHTTSQSGFRNGFQTEMRLGSKKIGHFKYHIGDDGAQNDAHIDPAHRGKGLGKHLLLHAIKVATETDLGFQSDQRGMTGDQKRVYASLEKSGHIEHVGLGHHKLTPKGESVADDHPETGRIASPDAFDESK
jgi:ribosomal protein S18 acetylase RimI-like enzyme